MKRSIAILSNINLGLLHNSLSEEGFSSFYTAEYNQWQQELLVSNSQLHISPVDYILLYIYPDFNHRSIADELITAVETYLNTGGKGKFLICELVGNPLSSYTFLRNNSEIEDSWNQDLYNFASQNDQIKILPFRQLVTLHGYQQLFDDKYWYLGRMRLSMLGNRQLARLTGNMVNALEGRSKKVLILDLDNTLWGGVAGEEGWQKLTLSNEGKGLIYKDFQRLISELNNRGILLSICSKNNESDVREVFNFHPDMLLNWNDFVAPRINWLSKDQNILSIASELGLSTDSFVFIDDSPTERELVRKSLPEVTVPEFPSDLTQLPQWLLQEVVYRYFATTIQTEEDLAKTLQYQRNSSREQESSRFSYPEFLEQLNIELEVRIASGHELTRIAQLTQKTNQFNLSGRRYTESEINKLHMQAGWIFYSCSYRDKFGDEGIVGTVLIEVENSRARIDNFLLSCRALGRRVEFEIMKRIIKDLQTRNCTVIDADFVPTDRNLPAAKFYTECGFNRIYDNNYQLQI